MYTSSRLQTIRRQTIEVQVGSVGLGAHHPLRLQSMTTSDTQDVEATVRQSIALAEVGCEIVRITAPNVPAAQCLKDIRRKLTDAGFGHIPLVADIHFLPSAAMEAVEHVEKIRVNPGNYADKKKFAVKEYSDSDYNQELERLHESFSPLVKRCKELGRAMRIGTNHGSLSDRIMNRYGDTPLGMVESALEFLRIAESHAYKNIVLSMKASNPKVMIQAYRLLVERMAQENMFYPLHLGVTEAGDGEDGRIKSAIGIGSLLADGLGDTLRVSLTEDSVYEIPVARALAEKAMSQWRPAAARVPELAPEKVDPYHFARRPVASCSLGARAALGGENPPRVIVRTQLGRLAADAAALSAPSLADTPAEGLLLPVAAPTELAAAEAALPASSPAALLFELPADAQPEAWGAALRALRREHWLVLRPDAGASTDVAHFARRAAAWAGAARPGAVLALEADPAWIPTLVASLREHGAARAVFSATAGAGHSIGRHRALAAALGAENFPSCIWIRTTKQSALREGADFLSRLLEASVLAGTLLCDGLGDALSIETEEDPVRAVKLAYNVLQGAGTRVSKTEFVACPSCGRTLFDLQTTTQRIRAQTGHLKGVKIAIMGCIVNGPGEMADADFGYVGGAPGKINLYVGKNCVQYNIPQAEADARLIALIREHGRWTEPGPAV